MAVKLEEKTKNDGKFEGKSAKILRKNKIQLRLINTKKKNGGKFPEKRKLEVYKFCRKVGKLKNR